MTKVVVYLLLGAFIAVALCFPSVLFPSLIFKGRKRDFGEPYYDLNGREWKIYRMPTGGNGDGGGGDGGGGGHCGGDGGGH